MSGFEINVNLTAEFSYISAPVDFSDELRRKHAQNALNVIMNDIKDAPEFRNLIIERFMKEGLIV